MADEQPQTIRAIHWRDVFPFLNLFRAFRVAIHPSKLVLGLTAAPPVACRCSAAYSVEAPST